MRGREFLMKDGYSFHKDEEDMKREFDNMEQTYSRIFKRLGLDFRVVEADSGAIGGSGSKEFMVLADSGEDTVVVCEGCDYGANIEAAVREPIKCEAEAPEDGIKAEFNTPDITTIDELSKFFHIHPYYIIKTVAKKAIYDGGKEKIVLFAIRGSDELQETKACNSVDANELVDVSDEELKSAGLAPGFMGILNIPEGVEVVVDNELKGASCVVTGANKKDYHLVNVNMIEYDGKYDDLVAVKEGDRCAKCGGKLRYTKGIEVGHIFQLGTRYSKPLNATFLDENGKSKPFVMGTYGIGVSRLLAAIIEQHHDDKGCKWTLESAPFKVEIIVSNISDELQNKKAQELYNQMLEDGIEVLLDDRKERFGFKMKDFELIGIPFGVIVGKKISNGVVEIVDRDTLNKEEISIDEVVEALRVRAGV